MIKKMRNLIEEHKKSKNMNKVHIHTNKMTKNKSNQISKIGIMNKMKWITLFKVKALNSLINNKQTNNLIRINHKWNNMKIKIIKWNNIKFKINLNNINNINSINNIKR